MGGKHARLSPSNHRWVYCPGSIREEARYPNESGPAAIDGTGTHVLLELCLKFGKYPYDYIGKEILNENHSWIVEKDRADRVQIVLDYILKRKFELGMNPIVLSETSSDPGYHHGRNDWRGTVDVVLLWENVLEIIDLKDGQTWVDVEKNPQLIAYAFGIFMNEQLKDDVVIKIIRTTVVQPKTSKPVRYVDYTPKELCAEADKIAEAAKATDDPEAPLTPGDHCTWCRHGRAGNCTAKNAVACEALKTLSSDDVNLFDALSNGTITPETMSNDQIAGFLDAKPLIGKLIERVEEEGLKRDEAGQTIPRYRKGTGRSSKKWNDDPEIIAKKLSGMRMKKADIYPVSLISPAQALKFDGLTDRQKKRVEDMIEIVPGKTKLVRSNNNNQMTAEDMFSGVKE